jgi:hypothetical protein
VVLYTQLASTLAIAMGSNFALFCYTLGMACDSSFLGCSVRCDHVHSRAFLNLCNWVTLPCSLGPIWIVLIRGGASSRQV